MAKLTVEERDQAVQRYINGYVSIIEVAVDITVSKRVALIEESVEEFEACKKF